MAADFLLKNRFDFDKSNRRNVRTEKQKSKIASGGNLMLVYFINIFLIIVWALIFRIGKKSRIKDIIYVIICFCQMFLISAYRFKVGYDYEMYAIGFFRMAADGFSVMTYEDWEIGYILINKLLGCFTAAQGPIMILTSFLSLIGPGYLIARYSKKPFMSVFLYVNFYLFYLDMNFIRQAIAMSVLCFAYGFLRDKKFWRFLLLVLLAASFHFTAIYMVAVYLVCLLKINSRTFLLYLFGLFYYFMLSDGVLNFVLSRFHTEYLGSEYIRNGLYFYFAVIPIIFALLMVLLSYYLRNIPRTLEIMIHFTLMAAFWQVVMTKHSLFERFSYYTMLFMVLAIPEAVDAFRNQMRADLREKYIDTVSMHNGMEEKKKNAIKAKNRKKTSAAAACVTLSILVLAFTYNMIGLVKASENGAHGVLPYNNRLRIEIPNIDSFFKG